MKNEDRIVELLAESLKRQDQLVSEMQQMRGGIQEMHSGIQEMHSGIQEMRGDIQEMKGTMIRVVRAVDSLVDVVKVAMERVKEIDSVKERLTRLERHTGLNS